MKKITFILTSIMLLCFLPSAAQMLPTGNLTVFSEDGSKFFVELNGVRYNNTPQAIVRIEELPHPYYNCKIVFTNTRSHQLINRNLMIADINGIMQDVTYRVKTNRQGKKSLNLYSFVPAEQNIVRPANCTIYRYGNPNHVIATNNPAVTEQVVVQQTTTTVSTNGTTVTTTTTATATTTTSNGGNQYEHQNNNERERNRGYRHAMSNADFAEATTTLANISFDDTRLLTAKQIIATNLLNSNQVMDIMKLFSFESNRLDFAKFAYKYCIDTNNYYKVINNLTFDSSKNELNYYIQSQV